MGQALRLSHNLLCLVYASLGLWLDSVFYLEISVSSIQALTQSNALYAASCPLGLSLLISIQGPPLCLTSQLQSFQSWGSVFVHLKKKKKKKKKQAVPGIWQDLLLLPTQTFTFECMFPLVSCIRVHTLDALNQRTVCGSLSSTMLHCPGS